MKILFIGDIVAKPGRRTVKEVLPDYLSDNKIDLVIANVENLSHGRGASLETIKEMQDAGVNYFTSGDHIFRQKDFENEIDHLPVLRPANYPGETPGKGFDIVKTSDGSSVLVINVMGRTFLNEKLDDPFTCVDKILDLTEDKNPEVIFVDFHAEATSEKAALGFYLDGRVDAVVGTHTHIPTCDNRVLPEGTAFVSDAGMTGVIDSVLGVRTDIIIDSYLTGRNQRFEWENAGKRAFRSVIIDTQKKTIDRFDREV